MTAQEFPMSNRAKLVCRPVARPQGDIAYRAAAVVAALMMLATAAFH